MAAPRPAAALPEDINVGQLKGDARGRTSGGDIKIVDIQGPVEMQTSGGDVCPRPGFPEDVCGDGN